MKLSICIFGMGYVGCANGLLLAKNNKVTMLDIDHFKVKNFNAGILPISDKEGEAFFAEKNLDIQAFESLDMVEGKVDFFILALPTNFNDQKGLYDTVSLELAISSILNKNSKAVIVIKSTINLGFIDAARDSFGTKNIFYCPEFLREGSAFQDCIFPSRIIIGDSSANAISFANLMLRESSNQSASILTMSPREAESVKLFSNTYLAMRVAFFNELDSFCLEHNIDVGSVISGVCLDPRIGSHYNNPSFGYGGYCLPKDSKQLLSAFDQIPQELIGAVVNSNVTRKKFLVSKILELQPHTIGVYSLSMKSGSDNHREASIVSLMQEPRLREINIIIYDKNIKQDNFLGYPVYKNFKEFCDQAQLILANRMSKQLEEYKSKVFTRDIFGSD
jgi:UDPglucose 6-dehydrogenase